MMQTSLVVRVLHSGAAFAGCQQTIAGEARGRDGQPVIAASLPNEWQCGANRRGVRPRAGSLSHADGVTTLRR
jgi:hypothetical protein